jgi:hypothetical protein
MADALANVIAVFPSTDSARWIVARLTSDSTMPHCFSTSDFVTGEAVRNPGAIEGANRLQRRRWTAS